MWLQGRSSTSLVFAHPEGPTTILLEGFLILKALAMINMIIPPKKIDDERE